MDRNNFEQGHVYASAAEVGVPTIALADPDT
jgi:hypothetical protein